MLYSVFLQSKRISDTKWQHSSSKLHEELMYIQNSGLELIDNCLCPRQELMWVFQKNSPNPSLQSAGRSVRRSAEMGGKFTDTHYTACYAKHVALLSAHPLHCRKIKHGLEEEKNWHTEVKRNSGALAFSIGQIHVTTTQMRWILWFIWTLIVIVCSWLALSPLQVPLF